MTRNEAVTKLKTLVDNHVFAETRMVDQLVALGLLKLDEPKRHADFPAHLVVELEHCGYRVPLGVFEKAMSAAGVKIVEA